MALKVVIKNRQQYEQAKADLADLRKAWKKILNAQSYSIGTNHLERANLKTVEEEISAYETAIDNYEKNGSTRCKGKRLIPLG